MNKEPPSILTSIGPAQAAPSARHIVVDVNISEQRWQEHIPWLEALAGEAARDACIAGWGAALAGVGSAEISLTFANDDFVRQLNGKHRGLDRPTNVLSFPALEAEELAAIRGRTPGDKSGDKGGDQSDGRAPAPVTLLGDVVLGLETILKEAEEQGKRAGDHVAHLVAHGVLHLLGFDHQQAEDAADMERLEAGIMENLGIEDPYGESADGDVR